MSPSCVAKRSIWSHRIERPEIISTRPSARVATARVCWRGWMRQAGCWPWIATSRPPPVPRRWPLGTAGHTPARAIRRHREYSRRHRHRQDTGGHHGSRCLVRAVRPAGAGIQLSGGRAAGYAHGSPQALTAAGWLNETSVDDLTRVIREFGEERHARRISRAIVAARPLSTTRELARVVAAARPEPRRRIHEATRVFQAIRIVVNQELDELPSGLEAIFQRLAIVGAWR